MNKKNLIYPVLVCFAVVALSGCGTAQKKHQQEEITGIKTKVETLESRVEGVEMKQAELDRIAAERAQMSDEYRSEGTATSNFEVKQRFDKSKIRVRDIQAALKNAGYYTGKVDGIKGKGTRRAIKDFQKANDLKADGIVGSKTWEVLSKYADAGGSGDTVK
ncbi:MAG: peptidoglycan-binding domain-containing protein [Candidatus Omnitrophota bacterium]